MKYWSTLDHHFIYVLMIAFGMAMAVCHPTIAQQVRIGNYSEVAIDYLVVSDRLPGGSALIKNLPDGIDMNTYPDASIMIKVKVHEIENDHVIKVCNECVLNDYYGFSKTRASRPLLTSSYDEYTVKYTYNGENLNKSLPSRLKIDLYIYHKNSNQRQEPIEKIHSQQSFGLVPPLEITSSKGKPVYSKVKEEETYWQDIREQEKKEKKIYKRRNLYEAYLKKYPYGKYTKSAKLKIEKFLQIEEDWADKKIAQKKKAVSKKESQNKVESNLTQPSPSENSKKNTTASSEAEAMPIADGKDSGPQKPGEYKGLLALILAIPFVAAILYLLNLKYQI